MLGSGQSNPGLLFAWLSNALGSKSNLLPLCDTFSFYFFDSDVSEKVRVMLMFKTGLMPNLVS